jgi:uncharacterized paraquat-inducible protein A
MKTITMFLAILLAGSATTFAQAKRTTTHKHQKTKVATNYTCEMHPEVMTTKPGTCPKCGMNLSAVKTKKTKTSKKSETKS